MPLTQKETDFLHRDPQSIKNEEKDELKGILEKIDDDDPLLVNATIMDAVLFERFRTFPHYEKASHWEKAANIAKRLNQKSAPLWGAAALHYRLNTYHSKAGSCSEAAALLAEKENFDEITILKHYRDARTSYLNDGDDANAHRVYISEYDLRRRNCNKLTELLYTLYRWTSLYGESPFRVAISAFLLIFLCSLVYLFFGLQSDEEVIHSFTTSFYFSVVTFTTLGYGDYSPLPGVSRIVAAVEAIFGLLLTSLFLLTFVRRFSR